MANREGECSLGESQKQKEPSIRGSVGEDSHNEIPCFVVVGGFEDQFFVPKNHNKSKVFLSRRNPLRHVFFHGGVWTVHLSMIRGHRFLRKIFTVDLFFFVQCCDTHTHTLDNRQRHQISWGLSRFFKPDVGEPSTLDCVLWANWCGTWRLWNYLVTKTALPLNDDFYKTWPGRICGGIHGYLGCYVGFHLYLLKKMLGGGFKNIVLFSPLGKWSNLTSIFFRWVVQPSTRMVSKLSKHSTNARRKPRKRSKLTKRNSNLGIMTNIKSSSRTEQLLPCPITKL